MNTEDYSSITGYLRVLEKRLMGRDGVDRAIEASDAAEALKILSQSDEYDFSSIERPEEYDKVLNAAFKKTIKYLYSAAPDKSALDVVLAKYDYHNVKVALKSKYTGRTNNDLYLDYTGTDPAMIADAVLTGSRPLKLPAHLAAAIGIAEPFYETGKNPQTADIALDRHMFGYQSSLANASENEFIIEFVKLLIDFFNIKTLLRAKNTDRDMKFLKDALCDGGKLSAKDILAKFEKEPSDIADAFKYKYFGDILREAADYYEKRGSFASLERLFDNYLIEYIKKTKLLSFGPEVLVSYLLARENEMRQIRIIMNCKLGGIAPSVLRERLRENYA